MGKCVGVWGEVWRDLGILRSVGRGVRNCIGVWGK